MLFQPNLTNLHQWLHSSAQKWVLMGRENYNSRCKPPTTSQNLYEDFKVLVEVALYYISRWLNTIGWISSLCDKMIDWQRPQRNSNQSTNTNFTRKEHTHTYIYEYISFEW